MPAEAVVQPRVPYRQKLSLFELFFESFKAEPPLLLRGSMPFCATKYFGQLDVPEDAVLTLPHGVLGFEAETSFVVIQRPAEYPLVYLQSAATPQLCFLALPVFTVAADYKLALAADDAHLLNVCEKPVIGSEVLCLVLVTVHDSSTTANLLGPIVVNLETRTGAQCINQAGNYSHREPLTVCEGAAA